MSERHFITNNVKGFFNVKYIFDLTIYLSVIFSFNYFIHSIKVLHDVLIS